MIEQPVENLPSRRDRSSLGWFGLGILVGAVAAIGLISLTTAPRTGMDAASVREAARLGAKDALLESSTGVTMPISLGDIRDAAKLGAQDALQAGGAPNAANPANDAAAAPINMDKITVRQNNIKGAAAATVTLIEYSDFQCPFCKRFHDTILPRIVTDYVTPGKVKLAYKNFAFLGDESKWAAQGAECAADQGRFWDFHDLLFSRQTGENVGTFTKANLLNYARELTFDIPAFQACLNGDKTLERVQTDTSEGNTLGVRGTPSFVINGKLLVGAQPYEAFKAALDEALKAR
ncbi:MAG TPA: DsbA family protein [Anaerolineae bacterium]|jgi:protein-disulfide isomerase